MELSRLSRENADLRSKLEAALHKVEDDLQTERERIISVLRKNIIQVRVMYVGEQDWIEIESASLLHLFQLLAPEMVVEKSVDEAASYLAFILNPDKAKRPRWVPKNSLKSWLSDLMTLGLVAPSARKHSLKDTNEYWSLTDEGQEILSLLRRQRLEAGEATITEGVQAS